MLKYTVKQSKVIGGSILLLTLTPKKSNHVLNFYPGQYAAIGFKKNGRPSPMRCFSIVSSPNNPEELQFAIQIQGKFTEAVMALEPGDKVFVRGPFGSFCVDPAYDRNVIMLAAGIGITPYISMLRSATEARLNIPMTLLYSTRDQSDIPFKKELLELEQQHPNLNVAFFITRGNVEKDPRIRFLSGRIDSRRLDQLVQGRYDRFTFFACGPQEFLQDMTAVLYDNGANPDKVITEEFTPINPKGVDVFTPVHNVTRWTYRLTAASLVGFSVFFMMLDLARAVPKAIKIANASAVAAKKSAASGSSGSSSSSSSTSSSPSTPSPSTTSPGSASNSSTNNTPTYAPTYTQPTPQPAPQPTQQVYQQPVTSIS